MLLVYNQFLEVEFRCVGILFLKSCVGYFCASPSISLVPFPESGFYLLAVTGNLVSSPTRVPTLIRKSLVLSNCHFNTYSNSFSSTPSTSSLKKVPLSYSTAANPMSPLTISYPLVMPVGTSLHTSD